MKALITLVGLIIFVLVSSPAWAQRITAQSSTQATTCRYLSGDVGTIIGQGQNIHQAREDASQQCFDRRASLYERLRGPLDEERGLDIIDSCVNIRCS